MIRKIFKRFRRRRWEKIWFSRLVKASNGPFGERNPWNIFTTPLRIMSEEDINRERGSIFVNFFVINSLENSEYSEKYKKILKKRLAPIEHKFQVNLENGNKIVKYAIDKKMPEGEPLPKFIAQMIENGKITVHKVKDSYSIKISNQSNTPMFFHPNCENINEGYLRMNDWICLDTKKGGLT